MNATHFNIGKKIEVNPFEGINFVVLSNNSTAHDFLRVWIDKKSNSVTTRKVNDVWKIMYSIETLDFTTLLSWIAPFRGVFWFKGHSVHFLIEDDIMTCW